jgi:peptidoglycan hydrolase-like protein with peptidoglycan-binding domain
MAGEDVRQLQLRLAALKYFPGPADGRFGMQTLEAVWAFQEVQGLKPVSEVGPAMRRALAHPGYPGHAFLYPSVTDPASSST